MSEFYQKPKVRAFQGSACKELSSLFRLHNLHTVCEEASCPNIGDCWNRGHASVMILGSVCTRACAFCDVSTGKPLALDPHEPDNLAKAISKMSLKHIVITSVDRDDLADGGANHFAECISKIRAVSDVTIEVLTPDFLGKGNACFSVFKAKPDVFNHNIETVPRLYASIRPKARYFNSLYLLRKAKEFDSRFFTKSGLMVGLGETKAEVLQVMDDLRSAEVDFITIGQYLRPTPKHAKVDRYVSKEEFEFYESAAYKKGFLMVSASSLTRSSYHADEDFEKLKARRNEAFDYN